MNRTIATRAYEFNFCVSPFQEPNVPVYYPSPNVRRPVNQLTEEEQVKIAKRIGLIQNLPSGIYDATAKSRE